MKFDKTLIVGLFVIFASILPTESKIVYLNGTEVKPEPSYRRANSTSPYKIFNIFDARNISNHSGQKFNRNPAINEDLEAEETSEEQHDDQSLATRSARQLGLFYAQRIMNALHLMALLIGIYLMIFVIDPVAIPHKYLAQYYYGLPWYDEIGDKLYGKPLVYHHPPTQFNLHREPNFGIEKKSWWPSDKNISSTHQIQRKINSYLEENHKKHHWHNLLKNTSIKQKQSQAKLNNFPQNSPLRIINQDTVSGTHVKEEKKRVISPTGSILSVRMQPTLNAQVRIKHKSN